VRIKYLYCSLLENDKIYLKIFHGEPKEKKRIVQCQKTEDILTFLVLGMYLIEQLLFFSICVPLRTCCKFMYVLSKVYSNIIGKKSSLIQNLGRR
jgi:hypothetical protein